MTTPVLPDGYSARPPIPADAEAVARVLSVSRQADGEPRPVTPEELLSDWAEIELPHEAVVVLSPTCEIVGSADVLNRAFCRISVYGYVVPEERGRGIGKWLVRWGEDWARDRLDRAPEGVRVVVDHFILSTATTARTLLEHLEYAPIRATYIMRAELEERPADPEWPENIGVRPFVRGQDEHRMFEAGEASFKDTWGRPAGTLESWTKGARSPDFDPRLWFLAEDLSGGTVAGICLVQLASGEGWVRTLGVRPEHRRKGLGVALLRHAFRALYDRGLRAVELSVDAESPTKAPSVYLRAGMSVTRTYVLYQKEIRAGRDFSTLVS